MRRLSVVAQELSCCWSWSLGDWGLHFRVANLVFGLWGEEPKLEIRVQTEGLGRAG